MRRIALNLQVFSHRFDEHHYFSTRRHRRFRRKAVPGRIRRLDGAARSSAHTKQAAIRDFAMGITQCADGAVSNLVEAPAIGQGRRRLRSTLWMIKEEAARNALRVPVQERYAWQENYLGNEIHYVTTAAGMRSPIDTGSRRTRRDTDAPGPGPSFPAGVRGPAEIRADAGSAFPGHGGTVQARFNASSRWPSRSCPALIRVQARCTEQPRDAR